MTWIAQIQNLNSKVRVYPLNQRLILMTVVITFHRQEACANLES